MSRENALCAILCGTVGKGYHLGSAEPFGGAFDGSPKQRFRDLPRVVSGLQEKGWRQSASHSTADRQSRPHFRAFQNLTIGVKMKVGENLGVK